MIIATYVLLLLVVLLLLFIPSIHFDYFFIEGEKKRAERADLNSADGTTVDQHDQFYRDHKLLLVLFRALGVMPITRSPGKP